MSLITLLTLLVVLASPDTALSLSAIELIKSKTEKQPRPLRSFVINGERNAEAENKSSVCLCQRNRSCTAPSHAYQAQPTCSPLEHCAPSKSVPRSHLKVMMPSSRLSSTHKPRYLLSNTLQWRDSRGASWLRTDKVLARRIFNHGEVLVSDWRLYDRPSVSSCQALGSSGIREMGCFILSLMLMCLPDTLFVRREKNTV